MCVPFQHFSVVNNEWYYKPFSSVSQLITETKVSIIGKYSTYKNKFIMTFKPNTSQLFSIFFLFTLNPTKKRSITEIAKIPIHEYKIIMSVEKFDE